MQMHRWAHLLKQQTPITIYRLQTKENKLLFPFAAKKWKLAVSVFLLQQTNRSLRFRFPFAANKQKFLFSVSFIFHIYIYINIVLYIQKTELYIYLYTYIYIYLYYVYFRFKRKTEAQAFFLNPFTICHCTSSSLSFVLLLTKKQTEVRQRTKWTQQTKLTCPSMCIYDYLKKHQR